VKNLSRRMSESAAPTRIHGASPKQVKLHEYFHRTERRRPKSDTPPPKTEVGSDTSDCHGGTRI
jgi:hypothetical protein